MKINVKSFMAGVLSATLALGAIVTVSGAAKNYVKTAELHYNDIKICVDGNYVQPTDASGNAVEPFIIDGTTYLPVRAVANTLGKEVDWDGDTKTVFLGKKPAVNVQAKGTMDDPIPMNTEKSVQVLNENYSAAVTIKEAYKGNEAMDLFARIKEGAEYHTISENKELFILKLSVTPTSNYTSGANPINYWSIKFSDGNTLLQADNIQLDLEYLFEKLDFSNYNGGTVEGYVAFAVEKTDKMPVMGFSTSASGDYGCWFSLEK